jgi:hypothetical protein
MWMEKAWRKTAKVNRHIILPLSIFPGRSDVGCGQTEMTTEFYEQKCDSVYQHFYDTYAGQGKSLYSS